MVSLKDNLAVIAFREIKHEHAFIVLALANLLSVLCILGFKGDR